MRDNIKGQLSCHSKSKGTQSGDFLMNCSHESVYVLDPSKNNQGLRAIKHKQPYIRGFNESVTLYKDPSKAVTPKTSLYDRFKNLLVSKLNILKKEQDSHEDVRKVLNDNLIRYCSDGYLYRTQNHLDITKL